MEQSDTSIMKKALESINERILNAIQRRPPHIIVSSHVPRLVAVSKTMSTFSIIQAYECGQRHFGENYIQELEEKSNSSEILAQCPDIKFHFIGRLQSNKVNKLLKIRNLHVLETIDSIKLADLVNRTVEKQIIEPIPHGWNHLFDEPSAVASCLRVDYKSESFRAKRLKVMVQVNTSGELSKSGIKPDDATQLAQHIVQNCQSLELAGIMTIGKIESWPEDEINQDFLKLYELRNEICRKVSLEPQTLELSMGMSADFETAIVMGSSSVRVGTLIFGYRKQNRAMMNDPRYSDELDHLES